MVLLGLVLTTLLFRGLLALRFSITYGFAVLSVLAFVVLIISMFAYPCRYTLMTDHLLIRSGAIRMRIDYAMIRDVRESRAPWAAPALSLERVRIDYAGGFQLVSPIQRERFMAELKQRVASAKQG